ncbi:MAG: MFS transporter [Promethearchaeota archaeon]
MPRELHGKRLIGYTMGNFGMSLANIFGSVFLFQYYVYTINLDSILVSIGISSNVIVSAFCSIIFGVIVDNKRPSRFGKRRPFLLIGLPFWVLTNILIWLPPWKCPQTNSMFLPTALYFWAMTIVRSIFGTLILNVYTSMLPEQSQTLKNRELVASIRVIFMIIGSVISLFLPLLVQSLLDEPQNVKWWDPSGEVVLLFIPIIGFIFAIFGLISILLVFFSVDESFHEVDPNYEKVKFSIANTFKHMALPAQDKKFRLLIMTDFIMSFGFFMGYLIFPFQTYILNFRQSQFFIYVLISVFGKLGWYVIWKQVIKRKTDTQGLLNSYIISILIGGMATFLNLFYFISISFEIKVFLYVIIFSSILGTDYALPLFTIPISASIIHKAASKIDPENIEKSISNISGIYYGLSGFMVSIGSAVASLIAGFVLSGPNQSNPTIILILFAMRGLFFIFPLIFLRKLKLND